MTVTVAAHRHWQRPGQPSPVTRPCPPGLAAARPVSAAIMIKVLRVSRRAARLPVQVVQRTVEIGQVETVLADPGRSRGISIALSFKKSEESRV